MFATRGYIARTPQQYGAINRQIVVTTIVALIATSVTLSTFRSGPAPQIPSISQTTNSSLSTGTRQNLISQPLAFEPNAGQTDRSVSFIAHAQGSTIFFQRAGLTISMAKSQQSDGADVVTPAASAVRMEFVGASTESLVADGAELPAKVNYIIGNDPANWHTNVQTYGGITYGDLYKGVTLKYEGVQGRLKGTYTVAAGVDPGQIQWRYTGMSGLSVDASGNLLVSSAASGGVLTEQAPIAWQVIRGNTVPVGVGYTASPDGTARFTLGTYDRSEPLVIDPTLDFSTYLGGTAMDEADGVAVDSSGNIFVTGQTTSTDFPTVAPYQATNHGTPDVFITKFNANGTVAYSTYLGGTAGDVAYGIAVDGAGNAYISGYTGSNNFPILNGYQTSYTGTCAFLTKLNAGGSALLYSTYFGGTSNDFGAGVAVDAAGNAYLTGITISANFPVKNAYQATFGGGFEDAFLARFDPTQTGAASLVYSTYLGGSGDDYAGTYSSSTPGHGVAVDATGNAYIAGQTTSTNFPTRNAFDSSANGTTDAWVAKINTGAVGDPSLVYSTYLGGSNADPAYDVAVDSAGSAYVTGQTSSNNFPVLNQFSNCTLASQSPFVTKFTPTGDALVYSTCFGGGGTPSDIAVDGSGRAHITGRTTSGTFPQINPLQPPGAGTDGFVLRLNPGGNTVAYSTYFGGNGTDFGIGVATDGVDKTIVVGSTTSTNFPTHNPYQPACNGNCAFYDAFVSVINDAAPIATWTPTATPTRTNTAIATSTATSTRTNTPTSTRTATPVATWTPTHTFTPIPGDLPPVITVPLNRPYRVGVEVGNYIALRFDAYDPDAGDIVTFSVSGLPAGSSFPIPAPGNPIFSTFTWEPNPSDIGTYFMTVTATDSYGAQDSATVEIDVVEGCVPYFSDVFTNDYFYPAVQYLFCHLVISGYLEPDQTSTFRPYNETTRGQFSKMIAGAYNLPPYDPPTPDFEDVPASSPFYSYIEAAYHAGIISGYADHTFRPGASITRGQLSKLVVRAAAWPIDVSDGPHFTDVPEDYTFYEVIETAYHHAIINGYPCGGENEPCDTDNHAYFRPGNTAIRGQIAKILWLALGGPLQR